MTSLPVDSISIKSEGKNQNSVKDLPFFIGGPIKRILAVASAFYKKTKEWHHFKKLKFSI
jgi:hypothetical protein